MYSNQLVGDYTMETLEDTRTTNLISGFGNGADVSQPATPMLLSLPTEILHMVLSNLSITDLTVCARVNKAFGTVTSSHIWKTIHITQWSKLNQLLAAEGRQGLVKNAEYIQELHLLSEDMFNLFVPRPHESSTDAASDSANASVKLPFVKCINLLRLVISVSNQRDYPTGPGHAPSPKELEFTTNMSHQTAKFLLDNLPRHITMLSIREIEGQEPFLGNKQVEEEEGKKLEPIQHRALMALELIGNFNGYEEEILLPFLDTCSNLTTFIVRGYDCFRNGRVRKALNHVGIYMESLFARDLFHGNNKFVNVTDKVKEAHIVETITMNWRLEYINLYDCPFVGHSTITAILGLAELIEDIELPCHSQVSAEDVQALLSHCKKLRSFLSNPRAWCRPPVLSLSATEFLSVEWASLSLWRFGCVLHVPRPDDQVPAEHRDTTWNSPTVEQSHEIQRQVYCHIAKQTRLTKLNLGALIKDQDPEYLWYSLEMTLESGLDELVGLKGMQFLTLDHMNHHVGIKELDWMCENWPKLYRIDGFHPSGEDLPKDIKQWSREHNVYILGCRS
ncbi:hypothetical protein CPB97_001926 [Podila verticillata]|nr:hypothetical protein CPB97_001926 [Podila verticillata]